MRFQVYHAKNPTFQAPHPSLNECSWVATVEANDLDEVFLLTNHIDKPWWGDDGIITFKPDSRSTSVGDLVLMESGGRWFRCEMAGWTEEKIRY